MKRISVFVALFTVMILFPLAEAFAQKSPARVPITYPGDTDETISRRMKWIEGARKEGALEWWGILNPDEGQKVFAEFNKVYPLIAGNYWRGKGEEVATKFEAESMAGRITVDVTLGAEVYNAPRWRKNGSLEKFIEIIPGIRTMEKRNFSKYGDWFRPGNSPKAPQYNSKLVSAAEVPKKWEDILEPQWKGRIAMTQDLKPWFMLALGEGGWGIEKTETFLARLRQQQPMWTPSHTTAQSLLMAGEFKMQVDGNVYQALQRQDKGMPIGWARVSPLPVSGAVMMLPKGPHPNAARLFLEWLFSPQGLVTYERITFYGVVAPGSGTRLAKALEGLETVYETEELVEKTADLGLADKFAKTLGITK